MTGGFFVRMAVFGIGGMGREVAPLARLATRASGGGDDPADVVFVDDDPLRPTTCNGFPVLAFCDLASPAHADRQVVAALGSGRARERVERRCLEAGLRLGQVIAPTARIFGETEIGPGAVICDFALISTNVRIGRSFQANYHSCVAHDCVVGDFVTLGPRACCNGNVEIGDHAYIGAGALIIQGSVGAPTRIGQGAIVGMGAVVTKTVPPYTVVVGNPARAIRMVEPPISNA